MPIHVPGPRSARGKRGQAPKRDVVAVLSLTAMVDLFTVLAVFLIQNYATTGEVIHIPEDVKLPEATETKELKPSNVVSISKDDVRLNNSIIVNLDRVKDQREWIIRGLREGIEKIIQEGEEEKASLRNQIRSVVSNKDEDDSAMGVDRFRKITIQADKNIDFLSVKKVMFTVTEAGIYEINFAVLKKEKQIQAAL